MFGNKTSARAAASLVVSAGVVLASAFLTAGPAAAASSPQSQTFSTPGVGTFTVPAGVTCIEVDVTAAAGGAGEGDGGGAGGRGGTIHGWLVTTPGTSLAYGVGAKGHDGSDGGVGGSQPSFLRGGAGGTYDHTFDNDPFREFVGGGGGAASYLDGPVHAWVQAGGGGGGGATTSIGAPGGSGGNALQNGGNGEATGGGGAPGGATGGSGGAAGFTGGSGGSAKVGSDPGFTDDYEYVGGGGGGGGFSGGDGGENTYFTIGAGGGGGGGGGTSYYDPTDMISGSGGAGSAGDGHVTITWQAGFTGTCGNAWDPVTGGGSGGSGSDGSGSGSGGSGSGSGGSGTVAATNTGSTFDTGVTLESQHDTARTVAWAGLLAGLLAVSGGGIILARTRRIRAEE
jgi:hypothetical protein